ncbi:hypothetical protein VN24_06215 [Paenibacillus beijingensis]|uniref:Aminoglycoside N(3)-acetyltransferase n=1 Tax=Paenibacillus beijingensis TaxID=1126833 RepID=A0A0D5NH15_9BACL|nr:hypothetical protein VN24_06215 [Paenibacillus beijingensis]
MVQDLRRLGIREGDQLLVHSSLSSLGWVFGGPQAVVQAGNAACKLFDMGEAVDYAKQWLMQHRLNG